MYYMYNVVTVFKRETKKRKNEVIQLRRNFFPPKILVLKEILSLFLVILLKLL
jgi:hypothetical protein